MNSSKAATADLFADYSPAIKVVPNKVAWQTHWLLEALSNYKRNSVCSLQRPSCFTDAPYLIRLVLIRLQMQSCICVSLLVCFEALSANNKALSHLHSFKSVNLLLAGIITVEDHIYLRNECVVIVMWRHMQKVK